MLGKSVGILVYTIAVFIASRGENDLQLQLKHKFLNRFAIQKIESTKFQFHEKQTDHAYTVIIQDAHPRRGVLLYYDQALGSMPIVFKEKGFRLIYKEYNSKYIGYVYVLGEEYHMEYMLNIGPGKGMHVKTQGTSGDYIARLHDILFLINNIEVKNA